MFNSFSIYSGSFSRTSFWETTVKMRNELLLIFIHFPLLPPNIKEPHSPPDDITSIALIAQTNEELVFFNTAYVSTCTSNTVQSCTYQLSYPFSVAGFNVCCRQPLLSSEVNPFSW